MADFVRKKLQVFVSSTFTDLIKERQAAVEAILTAGHIPAGMELFTAGDESQMEVIKQWIDESDVYVLILGARYGSIEPTTGKSYTQLEYEYALSKEKPLFACVIKDAAIDARVKAEGRSVIETKEPQKLQAFRELVLTKMSKFWEDTKDIKIAVTETLSHLARREDLVGWVRASSQSDLPAIADEITRLSKENAQLRMTRPEFVVTAQPRIWERGGTHPNTFILAAWLKNVGTGTAEAVVVDISRNSLPSPARDDWDIQRNAETIRIVSKKPIHPDDSVNIATWQLMIILGNGNVVPPDGYKGGPVRVSIMVRVRDQQPKKFEFEFTRDQINAREFKKIEPG